MPFVGQNHIKNNLPKTFTLTATNRYQVFELKATIISMSQRVAHSKSFIRQGYEFENIRDICEQAGRISS